MSVIGFPKFASATGGISLQETMVPLPLRRFIAMSIIATAGVVQAAPEIPAYLSPEQTAPGEVTFRVFAPSAKVVSLQGIRHRAAVPMTKSSDGLWSATLTDLPADVYTYSYDVDGTPTLDVKNRHFKKWITTENSVEVTGATPTAYAVENVEHGDLHRHTYVSAVAMKTLSFQVYTPPGYDPRGHVHYPVIVLCHGYGDDETAWVELGRVNYIADNLIAKGSIKKAIIIMPYGHPVTTPLKRGDDYWHDNNQAMESEVLNEVLPFVESHYLTLKKAEDRAIVGLSMGGGHALWIGLSHPEIFSWVGGFSSKTPAQELDTKFASWLQALKDKKRAPKAVWISIGREDFLLKENETFTAWLKQKEIPYSWHLSDGGHEWENWRAYFADFAQTLFR